MADLQLSIACGDYDHIRDLTSGKVRAEGISLLPSHLPVEEMFFRFTKFQAWDISEMSFAKAMAIVSQPNPWLALIPVFPSRAFRHSSIYVRSDRGIRTPADLAGKKVGIPEWAQTAAIYSRGMLASEYGVDLSSIDWYQAGVNEAGRREKVSLQLPPDIRYTPCPEHSLSGMLADGTLDAVLSARAPNVFFQKPHMVQRLFPDYRTAEWAYWKKTQVFPIMHVIALRRELYERHRWIVANLMEGFEQAKQRSLKRMADITASSVPLPWVSDYAGQSQQIMGEDFWPYGIEANRPTLEMFSRCAHQQGITTHHMALEEIFVPEALERVKV
jgi:4,5-dihydroxyphthalate decarboxylase